MAQSPQCNYLEDHSRMDQVLLLEKFDFRISVSHESAVYIPALLSSNVIYVSTGYFDKGFTLQRFATVELPNDRKRVVRLAFSNAASQLMLESLNEGEFFAAKIGSATTFDFGQLTNFAIHTRTTFEVEHEDAIRHDSIGALFFDRMVVFKNEISISLITPSDSKDEDIESIGFDYLRQVNRPQNLRVRNALVSLNQHLLDGPISKSDISLKLARFKSPAAVSEDIQIGPHGDFEALIFYSLYLKHNDQQRQDICDRTHFDCQLDNQCVFLSTEADPKSISFFDDSKESFQANEIIDASLLKIDDRDEEQKAMMIRYLDGEDPLPSDTFYRHVEDLPDKKIDQSKIPDLLQLSNFTHANHDAFSLPLI